MRSANSRTYFAAIVIFLVALLFLGWIFQMLMGSYLSKSAFSRLENQAQVMSDLTEAYYSQGSLSSMQFLFNLEIASQVADADSVICDAQGRILICSQNPTGCPHQGQILGGDLIARAQKNGKSTDTGIISGLYTEDRYVCAMTIRHNNAIIGYVLVSDPTADTIAVLDRIRDTFMVASLITVVIAVIVVMMMVVIAVIVVVMMVVIVMIVVVMMHSKLSFAS